MSPPILIVDDCADIARIISRYLEGAAYRTITVTSGPEAQRVLAHTTPSCIVLDLMMPGMSGTELLRDLRKDPVTADIPVILVSAQVGRFGTHFGNEVSADFSVGKPFTREQILQAVRTVTARRSKAGFKSAPAPAPPPPTRMDARARIAKVLGISDYRAQARG